jgi:hypothetical protein
MNEHAGGRFASRVHGQLNRSSGHHSLQQRGLAVRLDPLDEELGGLLRV